MAESTSAVRQEVAPTLVLVVAAFGAFLAFLDSTIVNVAFPSIQAAFAHTSFDSLSWVLNAYNIVFAAFLVAAGRIADLLGRRRMFVLGVAIFTLASAGCAGAGSVDGLIVFRVVQAFGAAVLVPASLAIVVEAFPPERRAHAIGLWGAAAALAAGLGPPIGGALVQAQSWRLAFLINVPLGVVAILVSRRNVVESRAPGVRTVPDLRGAGLLALALAALTLGVVKGQDWGWTSVSTSVAFVVAAAAALGVGLSSRRHPSPILDPTLLRVRPFAVATLVTIVASMGFYAYLLTHILWLHYVWGYSLLRAGLAVAPGAIVAAVAAAVLGRRADEQGYRRIAVAGALVWAAGFAWYIWLVDTTPHFLTEWLPGQLISGLGVGATLPILASAALAAVPGGRYAGASAVVSSARQIGAVLGIAILVVIIGVPTATSAAVVFRHGWIFCAFCFLAAAIGATFLGPGLAARPDVSDDEPAPAADVDPAGAVDLFASAPDSTVPSGAAGSVGGSALFVDLSEAARARIEQTADRVTVLAGEWLFRAGDEADGLYVVRTGRLEIVRDGVVVQELGRGGTLGELGVLTSAPRAASVRAKRDSHLLRLSTAQFDELVVTEPRILRTVSATVARWVQTSRPVGHADQARPAVIAVVALDPDAQAAAVGHHLVAGLRPYLRVVAPARLDANGLERAEADSDRVVLVAGTEDADWRSFCLRQADRTVLVSSRPGAPPPPLAGPAELNADLVLLGDRASRQDVIQWCDAYSPWSLTQLDGGPADLAAGLRPLIARIGGRSVGLVLSGGGARALAHIGVIEELEAAGLQVDRVAGASFGAVVGALFANGLDAQAIDAVCYESLVRRNPLNDYTVPVRSFARGRKLEVALNHFFGDVHIEELPREFRGVSVDLLNRQPVVHRRGRLADVVAASVRLPGLFAPYILGGRLHVDGGVMDNLPVSALTERDEGPVIAVNISAGGGSPSSGGPPRIPALGDTLMRSMMLGGGANTAAALERADLVITPETRGVGLLEFHQLDQMRAAGRRAARVALERFRATDVGSAEPTAAAAEGTASMNGHAPARRRPSPGPGRAVARP